MIADGHESKHKAAMCKRGTWGSTYNFITKTDRSVEYSQLTHSLHLLTRTIRLSLNFTYFVMQLNSNCKLAASDMVNVDTNSDTKL